MKKYFLTALMTTASLILLSQSGYAATGSYDDFGSTYFTAQTPDALGDTPTGNALAASGSTGMDNDNAEAISKIEPAAGGTTDDFGVFTLPEDPSATVSHSGGKLTPPSTPIVPGQTVNTTAK